MINARIGQKLKLMSAWFNPGTFILFIIDLLEGSTTNVKLFADDTSLLSVPYYSTPSSVSLSNDLLKIYQWACHWKMVFNSDVWKQAQQVVFSCKAIAANPETVYFNNDPVTGLILENKGMHAV